MKTKFFLINNNAGEYRYSLSIKLTSNFGNEVQYINGHYWQVAESAKEAKAKILQRVINDGVIDEMCDEVKEAGWGNYFQPEETQLRPFGEIN